MSNYPETEKLLEALCSVDGVSGCEQNAAEVATTLLSKFMPCEISTLGSVCGSYGSGETHILLDAHLDRIGLAVSAIDSEGFLKVVKCGGVDARVLAASPVTVYGKKPIKGVVASTPPHLSSGEDADKATAIDKILIDVGMTKEEAETVVSLGDRITLDGSFRKLMGNRFSGAAIDDRSGVAAILRCLQLLEGKETGCKISVQFSVQEEVTGSGAMTGAFSAEPDEAIAVDVSFAKAPAINNVDAELGKGTMIGYSPILDCKMSRKLEELAKANDIAYQKEIMGGLTGTNGDKIQISGKGVKTALLSIPLRNMHTCVEVCDTEDIENTAKLMAAYILERGKNND